MRSRKSLQIVTGPRILRASFEALCDRLVLSVNVGMIADINIGEVSGLENSTEWAELNGFVYFAADDGINGTELWKSDGTEAGTSLVADINQAFPEDPFATSDTDGSFPIQLTVFNDEVYFTATSEDDGDELWKTDGTEAGTVMVADINPGFDSSFPLHLTVFNGELYFGATTEEFGDEVWKTDGTEEGTVMLADINPGANSSFPSQLYVYEDELLFSAEGVDGNVELWKTDGTEEGTEQVAEIHPGDDLPSFPEAFFEFNNEIYFIAADDFVAPNVLSSHLFKTDGTEAGTLRVIDERLTIQFTLELPNVKEFKGHLYFGGISAGNEWELYRTDGTPGNSELVANLAGAFSSSPSDMVVFNDHLYFAANDDSGRQLWRTNGEIGEANVTERLTNVSFDNVGAFPTEFVVYKNELIFNAHNGTTYQVWRVGADGTIETLTDFEFSETSAFTSNFFPTDDRLYFRGSGADGLELWSLEVDETNQPDPIDPGELLPGDVDGNGVVDFPDFLTLSQNFGQAVNGGRADGDLDGNGIVEFADFLVLSQNFGATQAADALFANWD